MKFLKSIIVFIKNLFSKKKKDENPPEKEDVKKENETKEDTAGIGLVQNILLDTKFTIKSQGEPIVATVTFPEETTFHPFKLAINEIGKIENIKRCIFFNTGHFLELGILHDSISDLWLERIDGIYEAIRILDIKKVKNEEKNKTFISLEIIFEFIDNYMGNIAKMAFFSRDPNEFFKIGMRWKIDENKITPNDTRLRLIGFDLAIATDKIDEDKYRKLCEDSGFDTTSVHI